MILAAKRIVDDVDPNKLTERLFRRGVQPTIAKGEI